MLYLQDPLQAGFDPRNAEATYTALVQTLRDSGVITVDAVATARAFDVAGGQTFFRRDLHWTPEGANVVLTETASQIRQALGKTLPNAEFTLMRRPEDAGHRGQFVNSWTSENCGYLLPPEPLGVYDVSRTGPGAESAFPEVVLTGSSFSIEPYTYNFLGAALETDVLNASVGSGGAILALQRYLTGDAYRKHRPKVLVWEFPTYAPPIGPKTQLEILGALQQ